MAIDRRRRLDVAVSEMSFPERAASVVLGLSIAAIAARPRPNKGLSALALAAGSYLAWRGATGRTPIEDYFRDEA